MQGLVSREALGEPGRVQTLRSAGLRAGLQGLGSAGSSALLLQLLHPPLPPPRPQCTCREKEDALLHLV